MRRPATRSGARASAVASASSCAGRPGPTRAGRSWRSRPLPARPRPSLEVGPGPPATAITQAVGGRLDDALAHADEAVRHAPDADDRSTPGDAAQVRDRCSPASAGSTRPRSRRPARGATTADPPGPTSWRTRAGCTPGSSATLAASTMPWRHTTRASLPRPGRAARRAHGRPRRTARRTAGPPRRSTRWSRRSACVQRRAAATRRHRCSISSRSPTSTLIVRWTRPRLRRRRSRPSATRVDHVYPVHELWPPYTTGSTSRRRRRAAGSDLRPAARRRRVRSVGRGVGADRGDPRSAGSGRRRRGGVRRRGGGVRPGRASGRPAARMRQHATSSLWAGQPDAALAALAAADGFAADLPADDQAAQWNGRPRPRRGAELLRLDRAEEAVTRARKAVRRFRGVEGTVQAAYAGMALGDCWRTPAGRPKRPTRSRGARRAAVRERGGPQRIRRAGPPRGLASGR